MPTTIQLNIKKEKKENVVFSLLQELDVLDTPWPKYPHSWDFSETLFWYVFIVTAVDSDQVFFGG